MSVGANFVITEGPFPDTIQSPYGPTAGQSAGQGVQFTFSEAGRSLPRNDWTVARKIRVKRRDYAGTDIPTEQVLGSNFEPFTLEGVWDNRYNGGTTANFAEDTLHAFEEMS